MNDINCIPTFWVTMRKRKALNCGALTVAPGTLAGRECGESRTVLGFTIFSTSINQASRNSPVPSGSSECSKPSDTGTLPPMDRAQLNVLMNMKHFHLLIVIIIILKANTALFTEEVNQFSLYYTVIRGVAI